MTDHTQMAWSWWRTWPIFKFWAAQLYLWNG